VLKPGGVLASSVAQLDPDMATQYHVRGVFFLVEVTTGSLADISELLNSDNLTTNAGRVLPMADAPLAKRCLRGNPSEGAKSYWRWISDLRKVL